MERIMLKRGRHHSWCHPLQVASTAMVLIYASAFATAACAAAPEVQGGAVHKDIPSRLTVDPKASSYHTIRGSIMMSSRSPAGPEYNDLLTEPFLASSERDGGAISNSMQTELKSEEMLDRDNSAGRVSRSLLHGKPHTLDRYPRCPKCRMVQCKFGFCTGHCKKKGKLRE